MEKITYYVREKISDYKIREYEVTENVMSLKFFTHGGLRYYKKNPFEYLVLFESKGKLYK